MPGLVRPEPDRAASALNRGQRDRALTRMREQEFDIAVVGGGVTGCGIALDAASRGLSVALVEMHDYAAGTSSRSGKLIHGGLRYLEQLEFRLVRESLRERALMLHRLCPHLVRPVRFLYPLEHRIWERAYVGAGLLLYDTLGGAGAVPRHRHLSRRDALRLAPALRSDRLTGAVTFYDAAFDDARHTMELARTAAACGAEVATAAKAVGFLREGERVSGARVRDLETGAEFDLRARHVVNAAGVWTGEVQGMAGGRSTFSVRASKGVHILVPRERIRSEAAILVRAEDSVVFVRPWGRQWLIGTTDTTWAHDLSHPAANSGDIDYLLRQVNRVIDPPLTAEDIDSVYAGLRPLLAGDPKINSRLSREHAVESPVSGFTVIAGGKYTTYRVMAKDAVDAAVRALGRADVRPSRTHDLPLLGARDWLTRWNTRHRLAVENGLTTARAEHLLHRYGALVDDVLELLRFRPRLGEPIPGAEDYLLAEAHYAASHEGALHLDDVLCRRLRVSFEVRDRGVRASRAVAPVVAAVLGWDEAAIRAELDRYRRRVEAELASQRRPDDLSAQAAQAADQTP
ncbi:glycerol-3-phosphate dehydrogenase/oxidase [Streptomyces sp. NPDC052236]|uniref:glycerol-3-phosphate dehydrogenase/oxidase n=1 Tax=Streptomyces sp. NPDC052236 TaxID=3365686 RepID=UPI0037D43BDE